MNSTAMTFNDGPAVTGFVKFGTGHVAITCDGVSCRTMLKERDAEKLLTASVMVILAFKALQSEA